jgi:teichoic acid transport system ATP-binding protein
MAAMTDNPQNDFGSKQRIVEEMYKQWRENPDSLDKAWWTFFDRYQDKFPILDGATGAIELNPSFDSHSNQSDANLDAAAVSLNAEEASVVANSVTTSANTDGRIPVVVVDGVDVIYQVYASGKRANRYNGAASKKGARNQLRQVHAVKNVSFTVYKGETIGIIGTNGSGKSSLLRAVAGLTQPAKGAVYASARPVLLGVGGVLMPALSGEKNIFLGGLAMGYSRKDSEELAPAITEFAGLEEFIDLPMRTYSSGMSARLRFAIASSRSHDIMIIDEALSVGDQQFRKRSEARMREMRENAGTVFLVSHSMTSILDTCSRVIWLEKGVLRMDGDPQEVCAAYNEFTGVKTIDD